jgi:hypothetical protein
MGQAGGFPTQRHFDCAGGQEQQPLEKGLGAVYRQRDSRHQQADPRRGLHALGQEGPRQSQDGQRAEAPGPLQHAPESAGRHRVPDH